MNKDRFREILEKHKDKVNPYSYDEKEIEKIRELLYWFADEEYRNFYRNLQQKLKKDEPDKKRDPLL